MPTDVEFLKIHNIKAVLDLQFTYMDSPQTIEYVRDSLAKADIDYLAIRVTDDEFNLDIDKIWETGNNWLSDMEKKHPRKKDAIMVKCGAGISRSAAMLIYHYCVTRRMSYVEALNYVRDRENAYGAFSASPNGYFATVLKAMFKDSTYE